MSIVMETAAVEHGLADIAAATEELDAARAVAARRVEHLMAHWHGEAAASFTAAHDGWAAAADAVRAQLEMLRHGLAQARATLAGLDETTAADVARLGGRLG